MLKLSDRKRSSTIYFIWHLLINFSFPDISFTCRTLINCKYLSLQTSFFLNFKIDRIQLTPSHQKRNMYTSFMKFIYWCNISLCSFTTFYINFKRRHRLMSKLITDIFGTPSSAIYLEVKSQYIKGIWLHLIHSDELSILLRKKEINIETTCTNK